MSDTKQMLERARQRFEPPADVLGALVQRRERRQRNRRISATVLGIAVALATFAGLLWVLRTDGRPADEPTPGPRPSGIFSEVGGWIVYGDDRGIWAVDPSQPPESESRVRLSPETGIPLAWSSDGSKLLISRGSLEFSYGQTTSGRGLFVLHADGSETRLVGDPVSGASFSPDGSTVVFAPEWFMGSELLQLDRGIYAIDADGGEPRLLLAPSRRHLPDEERGYPAQLAFPTFSPDGRQIAFVDGMGDWGNSLRVMNADGTGVRALDGSDIEVIGWGGEPSPNDLGGHVRGLSWSPDGERLAVSVRDVVDLDTWMIYVVDIDGSGFTLTIRGGVNPHWSPDGSRISFGSQGNILKIADSDGTHVQTFVDDASGPWNPLLGSVPDVAESAEMPASSEGFSLASMLLPLAALLTLVATAFVIHRLRNARAR